MKQKIILILFLFFQTLIYCQDSIIAIDNKDKYFEQYISNDFLFYETNNEDLTLDNFLKLKNLDNFNEKSLFEKNGLNYNKFVWLKAQFKNNSKDTIPFVFSTSSTAKTEIFLNSKLRKEKHIFGNFLKNKEAYSDEHHNALLLKILPNESFTLVLKTKVYITSYIPSKITIYSKENYDHKILSTYRNNRLLSILFSLFGGVFAFLFLQNLIMFFLVQKKYYLFYSLYLFFTFLNSTLLFDRASSLFIGDFMSYQDLVFEITYTFSFIAYTLFIKFMIGKTSKSMNTIFNLFCWLMLLYVIIAIVIFINQDFNFSYTNYIVGKIFRIIFAITAFYVIYQLFKRIQITYIRYVFAGSIFLTASYLIHVIFNIIDGIRLSNNYYNYTGVLIEILCFTYALHLKTIFLENQKIKVENLNELKSRFFANISHEFRTPLTLIKSPLQSLQNSELDVEKLKKLELIDTNSKRILELIDQLLELSKIDSGNISIILKKGNIGDLISQIAESFIFQAKETTINFSCSITKTTTNHYYDKDVIEKIITNLLSNAFKYTPENEEVSFSTSIENDKLTIKISNSGSGVKKEELAVFFERFYQKNQTNQGVGIGLALVKELVDLYKGKIETSIEKNILTFTVILPLQATESNSLEINKISLENTIEPKNELPILLIVDDNFDIRQILKDIFKTKYSILEAKDGKEGLKIAQKEIPDCIISDVMMPNMNGFEFSSNIKNNELTSFIPIILLTAKSTDEAHLESLKSEADAFLTKPFNNEILIETVNQLLSERKKLQIRYSQELVLKPVDIVINSIDEKFLNKTQKILQLNLSNSDFTAEDFANEMNMSKMQLYRKLKSLIGLSANEFIRTERLKTASELLKKGNANISEIAYSVGFNDMSYFSKCFKEIYNCTPSEFAEKQ